MYLVYESMHKQVLQDRATGGHLMYGVTEQTWLTEINNLQLGRSGGLGAQHYVLFLSHFFL